MSEEVQAQKNNPLTIALDKVIDQAEAEAEAGVTEFDPAKELGVSVDHLTEFLESVIHNALAGAEEVEGLGRVLDMDDIGFMITLGVQVGMQVQKDGAA